MQIESLNYKNVALYQISNEICKCEPRFLRGAFKCIWEAFQGWACFPSLSQHALFFLPDEPFHNFEALKSVARRLGLVHMSKKKHHLLEQIRTELLHAD